MKVGDKYIIEIEEVIRRNGAPQIARIKGFNALVFDKYGLEKLEPYDGEKVYRKGYENGKNAVINESEKISTKDISDAYDKGLNVAWRFITDKVFNIDADTRNEIFNTHFCDNDWNWNKKKEKNIETDILDKIRDEIKQKIEQERFARSVFRGEEKDAVKAEQCTGSIFAYNNVIRLIDKYKAESEEV